MATIGSVITITVKQLGSRPAPARRAIITRTEDLGEGMYGAWFYTWGRAKLGHFNGTTTVNGTVLAVRDDEFVINGDVTTAFSAERLRRIRSGLCGSDLLRHHEGAKLLELVETHLEWVTS